MTTRQTGRWLAAFTCLLLAAAANAQDANLWQKHAEEAKKAHQQGDEAQAEKLLRLSYQEAEKFGPDDPRFAVSMHNLANFYATQGKYSQAEPLSQRAVAILEKVRGAEHPQTAMARVGLADLYQVESRFPEAEPLYLRSITSLEKGLGKDHTMVALALERYALLLRKTQRTTAADAVEARVKEIRSKLPSASSNQ
jgi:tetratricopeptide (TPR) repeat protein